MEKEVKNDFRRAFSLVLILSGVVLLGIIAFNQGNGNGITGAAVSASKPLINQPWLVSIVGISILISGIVSLTRLNE